MVQWGLDTPFSALLYFFSPKSRITLSNIVREGSWATCEVENHFGIYCRTLLQGIIKVTLRICSFLAIGQTSVFYHKMKSFFIK